MVSSSKNDQGCIATGGRGVRTRHRRTPENPRDCQPPAKGKMYLQTRQHKQGGAPRGAEHGVQGVTCEVMEDGPRRGRESDNTGANRGPAQGIQKVTSPLSLSLKTQGH